MWNEAQSECKILDPCYISCCLYFVDPHFNSLVCAATTEGYRLRRTKCWQGQNQDNEEQESQEMALIFLTAQRMSWTDTEKQLPSLWRVQVKT